MAKRQKHWAVKYRGEGDWAYAVPGFVSLDNVAGEDLAKSLLGGSRGDYGILSVQGVTAGRVEGILDNIDAVAEYAQIST